MDNELKFENKVKVGDVILAYDFEPIHGRPSQYIVGKVESKGVHPHGFKAFDVYVMHDTANCRTGMNVSVPMEISFSEYDTRIIKLA
jgi:hypothetical protein